MIVFATALCKVKEELDGLDCEILKLVLEALERELKTDEDRKNEWEVVRKMMQKAC